MNKIIGVTVSFPLVYLGVVYLPEDLFKVLGYLSFGGGLGFIVAWLTDDN